MLTRYKLHISEIKRKSRETKQPFISSDIDREAWKAAYDLVSWHTYNLQERGLIRRDKKGGRLWENCKATKDLLEMNNNWKRAMNSVNF